MRVRARKFARRYWIPLAAAVVVIASLATGLLVANRQRAIAQRRFADVRQLSAKLFDIDRQVSLLAGSTKARQLIVDTSLEYLRRLAADVHDDPDLALEVATAYMSVARVEGVTSGPNLGQIDEATATSRSRRGSSSRCWPLGRETAPLCCERPTSRTTAPGWRGRPATATTPWHWQRNPRRGSKPSPPARTIAEARR
jgi:hypothetical protein